MHLCVLEVNLKVNTQYTKIWITFVFTLGTLQILMKSVIAKESKLTAHFSIICLVRCRWHSGLEHHHLSTLTIYLSLQVNSRFGFGLLNADALVNLALEPNWETSPEKSICTVDVKDVNPEAVPQWVSLTATVIKLWPWPRTVTLIKVKDYKMSH